MIRMGVHVSIAGKMANAVDRAAERGCDVFQIFSRNPRGWRFKDLSFEEAEIFVRSLEGSGISLAVDHMPYLPNLASPREEIYRLSRETLTAELQRCERLEIPYLVTHLGSHLGAGWKQGFERIVDAVGCAFSEAQSKVMLLLESTAGTKNSMGGSFSDIAAIIEELGDARLGVCLDTCHLFAAGYELRTVEGFYQTLEEFDGSIGLQRLKVVHLNDSKGAFASRLDRHEHIGLGQIGTAGFKTILSSKKIRDLPIILETPVDSRRDDRENLRVARELAADLA